MFPGGALPVEGGVGELRRGSQDQHGGMQQPAAVYGYQFAAPARPGMGYDPHGVPAPAQQQQVPPAAQQQQQWVVLQPAPGGGMTDMQQQQHASMGITVVGADGSMSELQAMQAASMYLHPPHYLQQAQHQHPGIAASHAMMAAPPGGQMHVAGPGGMPMVMAGGLHHHQQQQQLQQQQPYGGVLWSDAPGMPQQAGQQRQQQHLAGGRPMMAGPGAGHHPLALSAAGPPVLKASSVEDLLQLLRRPPPPGMSVVEVVRESLQYLDSRALAALLKELSKTGRRDTAFQIFNWLRGPAQSMDPAYAGLLDVFTYTTMIAQCTSRMQLDTALALMDEMRARNVPANTHTYSSLLNVCVKAGNFPMALGVYNEMLSAGLQPNLVTFNTLLEVYAKQGMWRESVGVLDTLEQQRLVPEPRTFNIVMNACNSVGQFAECITVHDRMTEQSVAPTVGTYNAVLLAYCKLDQLAAAQRLFNEMRATGCQPTHTTFIMLLQSAESHGQAQVAVTLLEQMQAMQLCLTPQCYSAAIGACAAAGQLSTARKLLAELMSSNKAGMAAPAHIIIQNQDKCCDWGGAFGCYQKLIASNVRPDKQTTATAIEALWGAGHVGSCLLALKVFHASCKQGLFKAVASVHPSEPIIEFVVPGAGTCMAIVGLWTLLVEMRAKVAREGAGFLCRHVVLLLGDGHVAMPQLKQAMSQLCAVPGVPLQLDAASSSASQVVLTCASSDLAGWLLGDSYDAMCPLVPGVSELESLKPSAVLAAEEAAMAAAQEAYSSLLAAEGGFRKPEQVLPAAYGAARPAVWSQVLAACTQLQPQAAALPFAALVLLDQAVAAGLVEMPQGQDGAAPGSSGIAIVKAPLVAAAVLLASQAAATSQQPEAAAGAAAADTPPAVEPSSALAEEAVAEQLGVLPEQLQAAATQLRDACSAACAQPVSAVRVLDLFAQALMAGCLDYQVSKHTLVGDAHALAARAMAQPCAKDLSARDMAAVLLVAGRQAGGLYPIWPKCLVVLTGVRDPAALAPAAQLLQELSAAAPAS